MERWGSIHLRVVGCTDQDQVVFVRIRTQEIKNTGVPHKLYTEVWVVDTGEEGTVSKAVVYHPSLPDGLADCDALFELLKSGGITPERCTLNQLRWPLRWLTARGLESEGHPDPQLKEQIYHAVRRFTQSRWYQTREQQLTYTFVVAGVVSGRLLLVRWALNVPVNDPTRRHWNNEILVMLVGADSSTSITGKKTGARWVQGRGFDLRDILHRARDGEFDADQCSSAMLRIVGQQLSRCVIVPL